MRFLSEYVAGKNDVGGCGLKWFIVHGSQVQHDPTLFTDEGFLDKTGDEAEEDEKIFLVQPILLLLREIFNLKVMTALVPQPHCVTLRRVSSHGGGSRSFRWSI